MLARLGATALVLVALAACSATNPKTATSPSFDNCSIPAARTAVAAGSEARFVTSDGVRLAGVVWGTGTRAVVLGHMGGNTNNVCDWAVFARTLAGRGYLVLALDFRNYGSSQSVTGPNRFRQDLDVAAAVAEVRKRGAERVVIGGASLGGIAAMVAALSVQPPVNGVINIAAPSVVETMKARPAALTMPVLYIVAEADLEVVQDVEAQHAQTKTAGTELVTLPGSEHGTNLFGSSAARDKFEQSMIDFITGVTN